MSNMPPAKRVRVVAPKGSVANNPFRMLPEELVAEIQAMKKLVPTPSAIAIHAAGLRFERRYAELEVSIRRGHFIVAATSMRMDDMRVGTFTTNMLEFTTRTIPGAFGFSHDTSPNPALGNVLSRTEETALAYARYLAGHAPTADVLYYLTPPRHGNAYELHLHEQCLELSRERARRWAHLFPPTR